jgi:hypothetical protein
VPTVADNSELRSLVQQLSDAVEHGCEEFRKLGVQTDTVHAFLIVGDVLVPKAKRILGK